MTAHDRPIARHVVVYGWVQGVFFRETCRQQAVAAGVAGWVRNRPDGTVEALFEGAPEAVERLVAWAGRGPRSASVERVSVEEAQVRGLTSFDVR